MGLREIAEKDLAFILEDSTCGFGWSICLTSPQGLSANFTGYSNDIGQAIDPETGQLLTGRSASVSLRISSIISAGFELPEAIANSSLKPWVVMFDDINGCSHTFKVVQSNPDRALGIITCLLESYSDK